MEFLRNVLLNLIAPGEKGYSKTDMGEGFLLMELFPCLTVTQVQRRAFCLIFL